MKKRTDICKSVSERIIAELENGNVPWDKPWIGVKGAWPRSTGRPYGFLNQLILPPGEYATFAAIRKEGGMVNKGEKAYTIVFWDRFLKEYEEDGELKTKVIPFLKYFSVFNIEEQTNLEVKHEPETANGAESVKTLEEIKESYIERSGITFRETESDRAYYSPACDTVVVPTKEQFKETMGYYDTVFHEFGHSTGHESRLARELKGISFDIESYSREELVAELTSASVIANFGEETEYSFRNNVAYIQNWIKALKNDTEMIVWAAGRAEKALEMIVSDAEIGGKQDDREQKSDSVGEVTLAA